ncbi:MAG: sulfite exporter TauE/SafE family protein [Proteobacteria bacterium]|nr:MAG: sulfite exporter TauE/SafE family protein [Pseudomonadota bacterium]
MVEILVLLTSVFAGFMGSLLGIGGGMIIIPVLTLGLGVDIRYAIAASLVSIVATSSGAAASFLKDHLTNLRLAVVLEVGTVLGAATGFLIAKKINAQALYLLFGSFLAYTAISMFRKKGDSRARVNHPWSERLHLGGKFTERDGTVIHYGVEKVPLGLVFMYFAGILSAVLGIGSGIFKVMAMDGAMKLPMKVSSATSNFMIGVTATASAGAYLLSGDVQPEIACPVAIGIIVGSYFGAKLMPKMPAATIRKIFVVVLGIVSIQMLYKGIRS